MNLSKYQETALHYAGDHGELTLAVAAIGLAGETGEALELVKKHLGHGHELDVDRLSSELGDVLWYVARIASCCGIDLSRVAEANLAKLKKRYPNGFSHEKSRNRSE